MTANFDAYFNVYSDISDAETLANSVVINAVQCLVSVHFKVSGLE